MKTLLFLLVISLSFSCKSYQDFIEVNNIKTKKTFRIKRGDYIQCRYRLFADNQFTVGGEVREITDSTLVYRRSYLGPIKEIPISEIRNIDKISAKRIIVPSLVLGSIAGTCVVLIGGYKAGYDLLGEFTTVSTLLGTTYIFGINHRHLNKNKVDKTVTLKVFHKDSNGNIIIIEPKLKLYNDTINSYYQKN